MRKTYRPISKHIKTLTYHKKTLDPAADISIAKDNDEIENIDEYWKIAESVLDDDSNSIIDSSIGQSLNFEFKDKEKVAEVNNTAKLKENILPINLSDGSIMDSSICSAQGNGIFTESLIDNNALKEKTQMSVSAVKSNVKISDAESAHIEQDTITDSGIGGDTNNDMSVPLNDEIYEDLSVLDDSKKISEAETKPSFVQEIEFTEITEETKSVTEDILDDKEIATAKNKTKKGKKTKNVKPVSKKADKSDFDIFSSEGTNENNAYFDTKNIKEDRKKPMVRGKVYKKRSQKAQKAKKSVKSPENYKNDENNIELADLSMSNIVESKKRGRSSLSIEDIGRRRRVSIYGHNDHEIGMTGITTTYNGQSKLEPLVTSKDLETAVLFLNEGAFIEDAEAEVSFSLYIIKGTVDIHVDNVSYVYKRDSCIVINRKSRYSIFNVTKSNCTLFISYNV